MDNFEKEIEFWFVYALSNGNPLIGNKIWLEFANESAKYDLLKKLKNSGDRVERCPFV